MRVVRRAASETEALPSPQVISFDGEGIEHLWDYKGAVVAFAVYPACALLLVRRAAWLAPAAR